jgi:colicin import membrane protein
VHFTEKDFYIQQQEADRRWGLAWSLAGVIHGAIFLMVLYLPNFIETKPIMEEVVSVSLVTMTETTSQSAPPATAPKASKPVPVKKVKPVPPPPSKPVAAPEPPPPSEPVTIPEPPSPPPKAQVPAEPETALPEPVEATNPVSIFPQKRKVKKSQDTRLEEDKSREREVQQRQQEERELQKKIAERKQEVQRRKQEERELQKKIEERKREAEQKDLARKEAARQKELARAKIEQIRAENEARQLAEEARAAREALETTRSDATRQTRAIQKAATQTTSGRQQAQSIVEQTYWGAVAQRVRSFWVLPEMRNWDPSLLAKVVITLNKEGQVVRIEFEQRSKDPLFDQLVEKTINSAAPMPRFPALMQQDTTEVGFNFKPGELGNL